MRLGGYRQLRNDVCVFGKYRDLVGDEWNIIPNAPRILISIVVAHVDDLIFCGSAEEWVCFQKIISCFKHGESPQLTEDNVITFCGIDIALCKGRIATLSQIAYAQGLVPLGRSDLILQNTMLKTQDQIRTICKQFLGSLLWLLQTRYDLSFWSSLLSSLMVDSTVSVDALSEFIKLSKKICKLDVIPLKLFFHPLFHDVRQGYPLQLISFVDASYGNLSNAASMESAFITFAHPLTRDGSVRCIGHVSHYYAHRIHRICRSSISPEVIAIANLVDYVLWVKSLLIEVYGGICTRESLDESCTLPLMNPFLPGLPGEELKRELSELDTNLEKDSSHFRFLHTPSDRHCSKRIATICIWRVSAIIVNIRV